MIRYRGSFRFSRTFILLFMFLTSFFMIHTAPFVYAKDGDFVWAKRMGGTTIDEGYGIFVDSAGNVYTTGYFQGTNVDFDPGDGVANLSSTGNNDIFISKLDSNGNFIWARSIGGTSDDEGWGIFVDSAGNVYTTGYFVGTVDFDPGVGTAQLISKGSSDIFISKLDSNGNFVWAKAMGGTTDDYGYGIYVDSASNIYTTGYFQLIADFDPGVGTNELTSEGSYDIFISKLNGNGTFLWARAIGGSTFDVGLGISQYSSGHIYTTGYYQGTVDFDPEAGITNLTSEGSFDIFVSKLNSDGNLVWAKSMGGVSDDQGQGTSVDSSGNVYTTGWYNGTADFDPGPGAYNLISAGSADIFVSKLNSDGTFAWAKSMGGTVSDVGYDISVDSSFNVYTTGSFGDTADFDPGDGTFNLISTSTTNIFVNKLDSNGNFVWAKAMGGTFNNNGLDISIDSSNNVYTTGFFRGTADFDPGSGTFNLVSAGFEDIFISKLAGPSPAFYWPMFLPAILNKAQP